MRRRVLRGLYIAVTSMLITAGAGLSEPIIIAKQGSFFVGGTIIQAPGAFDPTQLLPFTNDGQTFRIDHLYAQFQIPPNARKLPLVMVHGFGQTGKTWESIPDGRAGYQTIFLRRGFAVYIVDFPRRAKAGVPSFNGPLGNLADAQVIPDATSRLGDQLAFILFRLGPEFPHFFSNTQFAKKGLDQFLRQSIAAVTDDPEVISEAIAALFDNIGPAILITHSQSGLFGWLTAIKCQNVKAIIAYEPTVFVFPEEEIPPPPPLADGSIFPTSRAVPPSDFERLTRMPIQIVYGDNIPTSPTPILPLDFSRVVSTVAREFIATVNRHGGDASSLMLPEVGLVGNTHFPFSDLNNLEVADLLSQFLQEKGLDGQGRR
jgi:pimeloyl-ACP methyl ester carboxylesterase